MLSKSSFLDSFRRRRRASQSSASPAPAHDDPASSSKVVIITSKDFEESQRASTPQEPPAAPPCAGASSATGTERSVPPRSNTRDDNYIETNPDQNNYNNSAASGNNSPAHHHSNPPRRLSRSSETSGFSSDIFDLYQSQPPQHASPVLPARVSPSKHISSSSQKPNSSPLHPQSSTLYSLSQSSSFSSFSRAPSPDRKNTTRFEPPAAGSSSPKKNPSLSSNLPATASVPDLSQDSSFSIFTPVPPPKGLFNPDQLQNLKEHMTLRDKYNRSRYEEYEDLADSLDKLTSGASSHGARRPNPARTSPQSASTHNSSSTMSPRAMSSSSVSAAISESPAPGKFPQTKHDSHYYDQFDTDVYDDHDIDAFSSRRPLSMYADARRPASRITSTPPVHQLRSTSRQRRYSIDDQAYFQYPQHMAQDPPAATGAAAFLSGKDYLRQDVVPRASSAIVKRASLQPQTGAGSSGSLWDDLEAVKAKLRRMKLSQGLPVQQEVSHESIDTNDQRKSPVLTRSQPHPQNDTGDSRRHSASFRHSIGTVSTSSVEQHAGDDSDFRRVNKPSAPAQYRSAGEKHLAEVLAYARRTWLGPNENATAPTADALLLERAAQDVLLLYDTAVGSDGGKSDPPDEESLGGASQQRQCTAAHLDALDRAALSLAGFLLQYLNTSSRGGSALSLVPPGGVLQQGHASTHSLESAGSGSAGSGTRARTSPVVGYSYAGNQASSQQQPASKSIGTPRVGPRSSSALGTPMVSSTPGGKGPRAWPGGSTAGASNEGLFEYDSADDLRVLSVSASGHSRRGSLGGSGTYSSLRSADRDSRRFGGGAATSLGHYSGM